MPTGKQNIATMKHILSLTAACLTIAGGQAQKPKPLRPNILIILADDMGYSDIGCFGSEINTPNLDRLASQGLRLTSFYNCARSCPSRATLLTGQYPHAAGIGGMTDSKINIPSYQGYINDQCVTIAEVLRKASYSCWLVGKWHVGDEPEHWPVPRGFDKDFAFIGGACSYFDGGAWRSKDWKFSDYGEMKFSYNGNLVRFPDTAGYMTDLLTGMACQFIEQHEDPNQPFFLHLTYTAPHWPLHARPSDIARYDGKYSVGWDSLRIARFEKQKRLGILAPGVTLSPRDPSVPAWNTLSDSAKASQQRLMAVYAAMVDRMDQGIGKVLQSLEKSGKLENTIIIFVSDNGGASAPTVPFLDPRFDPQALPGTPLSFTAYGKGWANLSNTPFRQYKAQLHEGGISSPCIVWYPAMIKANSINHTPAHLIDLLPTCAELGGTVSPESYKGKKVKPLPGVSLVPLLKGLSLNRNQPLCFEHFGNMAIIRDNWKLVRLNNGNWELYDRSTDRSETTNLIAVADAAIIQSLLRDYNQWADNSGVFPKDIVDARSMIK